MVVPTHHKKNYCSPACGCIFWLSSSLPAAQLPEKSPEVAARTAQGLVPLTVYSLMQFLVFLVLAELPSPLTPQLLTPVSPQSQLCSLLPKNCSSLSKGALNLLTQLCFSNPSYLTEQRKTSNSSRATSSPSCNILIFSWLLQGSLKFSRI